MSPEFPGKNTEIIGTSDVQNKADPAGLNKWIVLSVHWDVPSGAEKSSCWVSGKKLKSFQAKSSTGNMKMVFGDLNPISIAALKGNIQMFLLYKRFSLDERIIKAHHKVYCERYGVDHDPNLF